MKEYLTAKEEQALTEIVEAANALDGTNYTAPLDADGFFLSSHLGTPVAFLAVYFMGDTRAGRPVEEILLFTHPEFRKKGRAMRLLGKYLKQINQNSAEINLSPQNEENARTDSCKDKVMSTSLPDASNKFSTAEPVGLTDIPCVRISAYPSAVSRSFLEKRSAIHEHDELLMSRPLDDVSGGSIAKNPNSSVAAENSNADRQSTAAGQPESLSQPSAQQKNDLPGLDFPMSNACSQCGVKTYGATGYIYGVRTDESHLRQGSAEKLMGDVFAHLSSMGAETAILQVSSANIPAYSLYKKLGFQTAETLEIWYLPE